MLKPTDFLEIETRNYVGPVQIRIDHITHLCPYSFEDGDRKRVRCCYIYMVNGEKLEVRKLAAEIMAMIIQRSADPYR